jgi:hypothetical protein
MTTFQDPNDENPDGPCDDLERVNLGYCGACFKQKMKWARAENSAGSAGGGGDVMGLYQDQRNFSERNLRKNPHGGKAQP